MKEKIAEAAGLAFQRALVTQSAIPFTGATCKLREIIEAIDPKAWETICYAVADSNLSLIREEIEKVENPYPRVVPSNNAVCITVEEFMRIAYEECRQKILAMLKEGYIEK